jgi:hypothetical protein
MIFNEIDFSPQVDLSRMRCNKSPFRSLPIQNAKAATGVTLLEGSSITCCALLIPAKMLAV